jgi:hypothetical protein
MESTFQENNNCDINSAHQGIAVSSISSKSPFSTQLTNASPIPACLQPFLNITQTVTEEETFVTQWTLAKPAKVTKSFLLNAMESTPRL